MWSYVFAFVALLVSTCDAQLGRSCNTPNGERATCISIYDCDTLFDVVNTRDQSQIKFLRESQCGYQRNPLVCCGTDTNYRFTENQPTWTNPISTNRPRNPSTGVSSNVIDNSRCGLHSGNRILQGTVTGLDEFPWMALLEYQNVRGNLKFACGGTLISSRYILTAAHCVVGQILTKVGKPFKVRLGEHNTTTNPDCLQPRICNDPYEEFGIEQVIAHPDYKDNSVNRYNDIALIRLDRNAPFTDYIRPVCLPTVSDKSNVGDDLFVAGWGRTEIENFSPVKLKLKIPLAEKNQCSVRFRTAGVTLGNKQICAGGQRGRDSCTGDSGGPLMRTKSGTAQWYIEGIVSFGATCGSEGWPGIYTNVGEYIDWISRSIY